MVSVLVAEQHPYLHIMICRYAFCYCRPQFFSYHKNQRFVFCSTPGRILNPKILNDTSKLIFFYFLLSFTVMNVRHAANHYRIDRNGHTIDEVQHHSVAPIDTVTGKNVRIAIQDVVIGTKKEKIG